VSIASFRSVKVIYTRLLVNNRLYIMYSHTVNFDQIISFVLGLILESIEQ